VQTGDLECGRTCNSREVTRTQAENGGYPALDNDSAVGTYRGLQAPEHRVADTAEDAEGAALIGLVDVTAIEAQIAPLAAQRQRRDPPEPFGPFRFVDLGIDGPRSNIEFDAVARAHGCQRPTHRGFRGDVEDARAVAGA